MLLSTCNLVLGTWYLLLVTCDVLLVTVLMHQPSPDGYQRILYQGQRYLLELVERKETAEMVVVAVKAGVSEMN